MGQLLPKWLVLAEPALLDSGLNDEMGTRPVEACWRFAAAFYASSYPPETP
jgi:hypothetical protein